MLTRRGPRLVEDLRPGQELVSGLHGHAAIVRSVHRLIHSQRSLVTLRFNAGNTSMTVTSAHVVMGCVQRPYQHHSFRPSMVTELQPGDLLRSQSAQYQITGIDHDVTETVAGDSECPTSPQPHFCKMKLNAPPHILHSREVVSKCPTSPQPPSYVQHCSLRPLPF